MGLLRGLRLLGTALVLLSLMVESVRGGEYDLTVEVIDGGDLNINFMLILGADIIKQDNMKTDATHRVDLEKYGDNQICFDNSFSSLLVSAQLARFDWCWIRSGLYDLELVRRTFKNRKSAPSLMLQIDAQNMAKNSSLETN
ncbi:hypothetical protein DdX_10201 [Ditylenchus destructor]|uniref:GOLD domain-containing protein n=1 Tax=Ditylenchus destructor TaxID=166010 RepID=A0AAD4MZG6_9BILA|nr:hypothetical protein DdX_10201 [Ditylenchus destructor]